MKAAVVAVLIPSEHPTVILLITIMVRLITITLQSQLDRSSRRLRANTVGRIVPADGISKRSSRRSRATLAPLRRSTHDRTLTGHWISIARC